MSHLTIDITEQQRQTLKAMAVLEGKTIEQYALERLFPDGDGEEQALHELKVLLNERLAQVLRGDCVQDSITDIAKAELRRENAQ
jgi:hypothetical protein